MKATLRTIDSLYSSSVEGSPSDEALSAQSKQGYGPHTQITQSVQELPGLRTKQESSENRQSARKRA